MSRCALKLPCKRTLLMVKQQCTGCWWSNRMEVVYTGTSQGQQSWKCKSITVLFSLLLKNHEGWWHLPCSSSSSSDCSCVSAAKRVWWNAVPCLTSKCTCPLRWRPISPGSGCCYANLIQSCLRFLIQFLCTSGEVGFFTSLFWEQVIMTWKQEKIKCTRSKQLTVSADFVCVCVQHISSICSLHLNKRGCQVEQSSNILTDFFLFVSIVKTPLPKVTWCKIFLLKKDTLQCKRLPALQNTKCLQAIENHI